MAERNTAEELDDVYEIKYSTDAMTGGADKRMYLYYQLADSIKKADSVDIIVSFLMESCLLYTSPSPRDRTRSRMPSSA